MTTDTNEKNEPKKTLSLGGKGTLSLKTGGGSAPASSGRSGSVSSARSNRTVAVEVKRKRLTPQEMAKQAEDKARADAFIHLTDEEREHRLRALHQAQHAPAKEQVSIGQTRIISKNIVVDEEPIAPVVEAPDAPKKSKAEILREQELARMRQIDDQDRAKAGEAEKKRQETVKKNPSFGRAGGPAATPAIPPASVDERGKGTGRKIAGYTSERDNEEARLEALNKKLKTPASREEPRRRGSGKLNVNRVINEDFEEREYKGPSMAAQRRQREKMKAQMRKDQDYAKQFREVIIPEAITVQELANRMSERVGDVVKKLMLLGVMATANQTVDTDTAELIVREMGHTPKRVAEADVEQAISGVENSAENLLPRPPVVTIMGHVDHGKTSLLDAIRSANVVSGEAGGITQHIGAYQIETASKQKITFIDTPGHAAFSEMRARGADVTDIVILVVAADDSVMPQTIEAIHHAKAAKKTIIVAINKCDLPGADPMKVRTELLQHEVQVEEMGGEIQSVEVSAKTKKGLDALEEAILLQAEILQLKANPNRPATGAVIESKMEQGRGSVATVLIQSGTVKVGDIFVTGTQWGRVRALINDLGKPIDKGIPGMPVEVLGLTGAPEAGDDFSVVETEAKAREIAEFRLHRRRKLEVAKAGRGSIEQMMHQIKQGTRELAVIIKGDVHGSIEAIASSLRKLTETNTEVRVTILHTAVGAITESDITLSKASKALIIGFNVRANPQARDIAKRDGIEIRYYSIIYNVIDDVKALLSGLLSPEVSEQFIGYAEIRKVFDVSKFGRIAGCYVTSGIVKRGAKVRLLRDNVVIHEGTLKTLRRFKDEVRDVKEGFECGMAFENYDDIKDNDVIECFEIQQKARAFEVAS